MSEEWHVEIKVLPILARNQKDRHQNLVRITVCEAVPEKVVGLYVEKAKSFVSFLVMLSILSDVALSLPRITHVEEEEEGTEQPQLGNVLVATETKTDDVDEPYVDFSGSHRVYYATVDGYRVRGGMIHAFKQQLRAIAEFHPWIVVVD